VTVTLKQVEDALASVHPLSGVIVRAGGKVVATQEPRPLGDGCIIIVLDHTPRPPDESGFRKLEEYRAQPRRSFLEGKRER
jgi:hypothetical protein